MSRIRLPAEQRRQFEISSLANQKLLQEASVLAFICNSKGEPSPGGRYLRIENNGVQDIYFAEAGFEGGMTFLPTQQVSLLKISPSPMSGFCSGTTIFNLDVLFTSRSKHASEPPAPVMGTSSSSPPHTPGSQLFSISPPIANTSPSTATVKSQPQAVRIGMPPSPVLPARRVVVAPAPPSPSPAGDSGSPETAKAHAGLPRPVIPCVPALVSGLNPPAPQVSPKLGRR
eukprot:m.9733 g.9733  ORF g.9733 m.9733 type:complete len:229 (-) comp5465_c0_seq1:118-804(-)